MVKNNHITSIDLKELYKFNKTTDEWWDLNGEFKMLHKINPIRIDYIVQKIKNHFALESSYHQQLSGLSILDVGCGGGIVSMPLAKLGAKVTGIDANQSNVDAASSYAIKNGLAVEFQNITAENLAASGAKYDIVVALEIIEHVSSPAEFVKNLTTLVKPGGMLIISTINRTIKSYVYTILMAEYLLRMVPKHTHDHRKFIKPSELNQMLSGTKLSLKELRGLKLDMPSNKWSLSMDVEVNYFAYIG